MCGCIFETMLSVEGTELYDRRCEHVASKITNVARDKQRHLANVEKLAAIVSNTSIPSAAQQQSDSLGHYRKHEIGSIHVEALTSLVVSAMRRSKSDPQAILPHDQPGKAVHFVAAIFIASTTDAEKDLLKALFLRALPGGQAQGKERFARSYRYLFDLGAELMTKQGNTYLKCFNNDEATKVAARDLNSVCGAHGRAHSVASTRDASSHQAVCTPSEDQQLQPCAAIDSSKNPHSLREPTFTASPNAIATQLGLISKVKASVAMMPLTGLRDELKKHDLRLGKLEVGHGDLDARITVVRRHPLA